MSKLAWLISEGRARFESAIANPDSLAEVPQQDYFELESFAYEALKAYESKGGGELERDFSIELASPVGEEWSEDDLPERFPRLAEKYEVQRIRLDRACRDLNRRLDEPGFWARWWHRKYLLGMGCRVEAWR